MVSEIQLHEDNMYNYNDVGVNFVNTLVKLPLGKLHRREVVNFVNTLVKLGKYL